ncbi:hypothetical protein ACFFJB_00545 [Camelimonas abortus]|uniref:Uncharacterized protein n=1 Tax=Camelimonas abortus TaxID=1017184 RepID=A0ABV7LEN9_9HYPH
MFIHVTDPADNARILLNASCILMVRAAVHGGSVIYLSTGAAHHPDVLRAQETPEEIAAMLGRLGLLSGDAADAPAETAAAAR